MSKVLSQTPDAIRKRAARARASGIMEMIVVSPAVAEVAPAIVDAAVEAIIAGETFTHVGYATDKKGKGAVRYTNDKRRTRTLVRAGCTDVKFVELPQPMSKADIDASEFIAQVMPVVAETAVA